MTMWMARSFNVYGCEISVSCAAVQNQRGRDERGGGVTATREEGAPVQYVPAGRRQSDFKRGNPAPERQDP